MTTATVTLRDARAAGYCARGCRTWCERYRFDWAEFRGPGLPLEAVRATGDAMALRLVQQVLLGAALAALDQAGAGDHG